MDEIWKDIPGYEGIYQASNFGRIKSLARRDRIGHRWPTRILRPQKTIYGYHQVILARNGTTILKYVHRLVLEAFVGPCPPGKQCNHINGNKIDNSISNLEYCTNQENQIHAYQHLGKQAARGSKQGGAKLTEAQVIEIRALHDSGITGKQLADIFNVSRASVCRIIQRKVWAWLK